VLKSLKRPHLDYFRDFYADTALFGAGNGLQCGLDFFGAEHVVFSTDAPLGPIAKTIAAVNELGLDASARARIMSGNAKRLLNLE
jgi:aminocarboxymuconate-semialdehyde decarboxylase